MKTKKPLNPLYFSLLSVLVGIIAGLGAVVFRGLIAIFHNLLFLGKFSYLYDANAHTPPSPWGALIILVPVLGAFGVAFLVKNFAPEAKGHGVPEVMDAIYYSRGIIRPVVAVIKSVASALSIGSGGAIGREGPIIQIGSSFGSTLGQLIPMPVWQRLTLIAAGAGGGIAATFNTPVGGVLFAVEIMMHELSVRTLVPVTIATATATYIGRAFFGDHPSFIIPKFQTPYFHITQPLILFAYLGLGIIMGLVSTIYIKSIYAFEDFFEKRIKRSYYFRHMTGMLLVGVTMYLLFVTQGHYYVEGVGYATVQDILTGTLSSLGILMLLFVLKLMTVSLTLGSGASGGIFSPGLFMGATLGGAYGVILDILFPSLTISPPAFAVAGMAGVIGGSTGAAMAAIVMIFEMTLDYNVIIPMTITVALSFGIRKFLSRESIYTLKLARRGHNMPESLQADYHYMRRARDIMETPANVISPNYPLDKFVRERSDQDSISYYVVADDAGIQGVISNYTALKALSRSDDPLTVEDVASKNYIAVTENTTMFDVLTRMRANVASVALVTDRSQPTSCSDVKGLISKEVIAKSTEEALELFADESP
ncbi:MAG: chloride channel protein [Anaerolineales bacterium]|jgi:CIC family chloride channel protein